MSCFNEEVLCTARIANDKINRNNRKYDIESIISASPMIIATIDKPDNLYIENGITPYLYTRSNWENICYDEEPKKITYNTMKCKSCNADLDISENKDIITCSYCGTRYYNKDKWSVE